MIFVVIFGYFDYLYLQIQIYLVITKTYSTALWHQVHTPALAKPKNIRVSMTFPMLLTRRNHTDCMVLGTSPEQSNQKVGLPRVRSRWPLMLCPGLGLRQSGSRAPQQVEAGKMQRWLRSLWLLCANFKAQWTSNRRSRLLVSWLSWSPVSTSSSAPFPSWLTPLGWLEGEAWVVSTN